MMKISVADGMVVIVRVLQVHRVHALCLLAHALLHDQAAADTELQVNSNA